jgi:hypothetical protein
VKIRVRRRLFRNPVATYGRAVVADIHRTTEGGYRWEALLKPYADGNGPGNCPMGAVRGMTLATLGARLETRVNARGKWWT